MRPVPWNEVILFFLNRKATPLVVASTTSPLRFISWAKSSVGGAEHDAVHGEIVARLLEQVRGLQQRLGRDAADIEAGAAEGRALLDHRHLHAELGGADRRHIAARSGADHDEIEGFVCHDANRPSAHAVIPSAARDLSLVRHRRSLAALGMTRVVATWCVLHAEQQPLGILDAFLDPHQEQHGLAAVDDAVVVVTGRGTSSAAP